MTIREQAASILDEELMTPEELAARLRVTENYLSQLRFRGDGPRFIRHGRVIRYRPSEVERWLAEGEAGGAA
jgi:hypothetical protein